MSLSRFESEEVRQRLHGIAKSWVSEHLLEVGGVVLITVKTPTIGKDNEGNEIVSTEDEQELWLKNEAWAYMYALEAALEPDQHPCFAELKDRARPA